LCVPIIVFPVVFPVVFLVIIPVMFSVIVFPVVIPVIIVDFLVMTLLCSGLIGLIGMGRRTQPTDQDSAIFNTSTVCF
jgi:integral membrane sensor domain MASE1